MKKLLVSTAVAAAIASGLALAPAADATPNGCTWWGKGSMSAHARCTGGQGGAYQVYARCQYFMWPSGWEFKEGPWQPATMGGFGAVSNLSCTPGYIVQDGGVGLRR